MRRSTCVTRGRIATIEFDGQRWFEHLFGHYTPAEVIKKEMDSRFSSSPKAYLFHRFSRAPRLPFTASLKTV
jgi:hypothetical protein